MNEDVVQAWNRISGWLRVHAPVSYASIRPPAGQAAIDAAEARIGVPLPDDLRTLLSLADGCALEPAHIEKNEEEGEIWNAQFLQGEVLLSLDRIVRRYDDLTHPPIGSDPFRGLLPWLSPDPEDWFSCWLVSTRPDSHGALAKWSEPEAPYMLTTGPVTVAELLTAHADALETGTGPLMSSACDDVPGVIWGCVHWDNPSDISLLAHPEDWTPVHPRREAG
ncbi:SMI1/KNR4 family protein [Streptomyces poonensis]|uniref:Knr4/Smi1-like domain-containing protein n=1 Tax=Streptomyces poonensis TaxID=68255 RepID=A0A918Q1X1_9ACTN|nr:SMI1/KNR4 family protein [Streptomyces poonensis]GGZ30906.1 hypothetical protein GCM10010365_59280 [Streptomyces poonensis]GLJ88253.1 hypothetical protein GCM10017589_08530 [Streptomyces poonensis]